MTRIPFTSSSSSNSQDTLYIKIQIFKLFIYEPSFCSSFWLVWLYKYMQCVSDTNTIIKRFHSCVRHYTQQIKMKSTRGPACSSSFKFIPISTKVQNLSSQITQTRITESILSFSSKTIYELNQYVYESSTRWRVMLTTP